MVVSVLRPLRCWMRMCTRPSCTLSSSPLAASAKGSAKGRKGKESGNREILRVILRVLPHK